MSDIEVVTLPKEVQQCKKINKHQIDFILTGKLHIQPTGLDLKTSPLHPILI